MSDLTPVQKRQAARERAIAEGRIKAPTDRLAKAKDRPMSDQERLEAEQREARRKLDAFDPTPLGVDLREIEYDDETFYVTFAKADDWERLEGGNATDADAAAESGDVAAVVRELQEFFEPDEYERAKDVCREKYGMVSQRWMVGLLREIVKHPDLGN